MGDDRGKPFRLPISGELLPAPDAGLCDKGGEAIEFPPFDQENRVDVLARAYGFLTPDRRGSQWIPGSFPNNGSFPVWLPAFLFLLVQDLSGRFMLPRLSEGNGHHHPFQSFPHAHCLSSSHLQLFWPSLCPKRKSISVPGQGKSIYPVDIIRFSRDFQSCPKLL